MNITKRRLWSPEIPILRGIAILWVVLIHATAGYISNIYPGQEFYQIPFWLRLSRATILEAVPTFIFVSGFVYHLGQGVSRLSGLYAFTEKRVRRLLIPYAVFSIVYICLRLVVDRYSPFHLNQSYEPSFCNLVRMFAGIGSPAPHLYFLIASFGVGITFTLLDILTSKFPYKTVSLGLVSFIILVLVSVLKVGYPLNYLGYLMNYYLGWLFAGIYKGERKLLGWVRYALIIAFGAFFILKIINNDLKIYNMLTIAISQLMPIMAFLFVTWLFNVAPGVSRALAWFGGYAMAIYLLHDPFGTSMLNALYYRVLDGNSFIIGVTVATILPLAGATILAILLSKTFLYQFLFGEKPIMLRQRTWARRDN